MVPLVNLWCDCEHKSLHLIAANHCLIEFSCSTSEAGIFACTSLKYPKAVSHILVLCARPAVRFQFCSYSQSVFK